MFYYILFPNNSFTLLFHSIAIPQTASAKEMHAKLVREQQDKDKPLARTEYLIMGYISLLQSEILATRANVERKATLTEKERVRALNEYYYIFI